MEKAMQYAYRDRKTKRENLGLYGYKELTLVLELRFNLRKIINGLAKSKLNR